MKYSIHQILGLLVLATILSCGEYPCSECVDPNGTIKLTSATVL